MAVSPGTVLQLCLLYDLDQPTTKELYALAFGSQQSGWWESREELLKTGFGLFIGLESVAAVIQIDDPFW